MTRRADGYMDVMEPDQDSMLQPLLEMFAEIRLHLGRMNEREDAKAQERRMLNQYIYPVDIPAMTGNTGTAATVTLGNSELTGPRRGNVWDIRRVTITGLASNDVLSLYRVSSVSSASAVPQNLVTTFSNANPAPYAPGLGALLLRPNQCLMAYGTSLTTNEQITMTADGVNVAEPWLGAYLL